jgi:uncharacterized coiled-coil protein SlyX
VDLSQATKLLTWLDEEHRKDKALLMALQSQIDAQKAQLTEHARQMQDTQAALTRLEGQSPRIGQLESSIQGARSEFAALLTKQTADQETRQEQRMRADKLEGGTMARLVRQLQERVEGLGTFDSSVALLRDEDGRLQAELSKLATQIAEVVKRLGTQDQRLGLLSQEGQTLREGLASARLSDEDMREQGMSLKAAIDAIAPPLDAKVEQLQLSVIELSKGRQADLDPFQLRLQEQARQIEALSESVTAVQVPIDRWAKQMEELTGQYERNRKTLYEMHEVERAIRQQGRELTELQRLAAERQRAELREWQDSQSRVDEEQTVRIEQAEAWQRKTAETLVGLEKDLQEIRRDIVTRSEQIWQVWSEFMRQQAKVFGEFKQRRAG